MPLARPFSVDALHGEMIELTNLIYYDAKIGLFLDGFNLLEGLYSWHSNLSFFFVLSSNIQDSQVHM